MTLLEEQSIYGEFFLIILLIIANGCFSMTEIAVISSRTSRLKTKAKSGSTGAKIILEISKDPSDFLSAIQIGITLIGILTGAFGGMTFSKYLAPFFKQFVLTQKFADSLALFIVVSIITYLSLVIGELVPKKIAINNPERIAIFAARPVKIFLFLFKPFVKLLSFSSAFIFGLLGMSKTDNDIITEEELLLTLDVGAKSGVVENAEIDIMKNILESNDMCIGSIMIPRNMVVWLNSSNSLQKNLKIIESTQYDCYPLAEDDLDNMQGFVFTNDLVTFLNTKQPVDFFSIRKKPFSIPENMSVLKALLTFSKENCKVALVVDEFGSIAGIIEAQDIVRCLTGDMEKLRRSEGIPQIISRGENSWLMDGMLPISEFKDFLDVDELPDEEKYRYNTLAGFIIALLGHIPAIGEKTTWNGYTFEIVDMDNKRIDMVMLTKE